jgi:WD40 repeat protein
VVRIWEVETGQELRQYEGHTDAVASVAFFPDGKRIVFASYDGTARIWRAPK